MMNVKQEPLDLYEDDVKIEPDYVNVDEIKQEIMGYEVPKVEQCTNYLLPTSNQDLLFEHVQLDPTIVVKKELDNIEFKATSCISNIKQEIEFKTDNELLTTHCDLPTLKSETTEFTESYGRKKDKRTSPPFKHIAKVASKTKKRYPCPVCQKNFISSKPRSKHINGHFRKRFVVCEFCGKRMRKNEFLQHYFIHLVKNRTRKVPQIINTKQNVTIDTRVKVHKCDICSKTFKKKSNLHRHLIIHTDDKPFKCNICSKEFKFKSILQDHLLIHTNETKYPCDICSKEFNQKSYLRKHLKVHAKEKSFKCVICFKGFADKINLQQHLIIHFNQTPFKCDICFKEFTQKNNLQKHLIIHSNETPFKCDVCSNEFKRKSILQRHVLTHSNKKPSQ